MYLNKDDVTVNGNTYHIIRSKKHKKQGYTYYVIGGSLKRPKTFQDQKKVSGLAKALRWINEREGVEVEQEVQGVPEELAGVGITFASK